MLSLPNLLFVYLYGAAKCEGGCLEQRLEEVNKNMDIIRVSMREISKFSKLSQTEAKMQKTISNFQEELRLFRRDLNDISDPK